MILWWFYNSLDQLDLSWPSLNGRVPLAWRKRSSRWDSTFFLVKAPLWEVAPVPQCRCLNVYELHQKRNHQQQRRSFPPAVCLAPELLLCFSQKWAFSSRQAKNLQVSLPNFWISRSNLRNVESLMLFPEAKHLILQHNDLLKSVKKWPILLWRQEIKLKVSNHSTVIHLKQTAHFKRLTIMSCKQ